MKALPSSLGAPMGRNGVREPSAGESAWRTLAAMSSDLLALLDAHGRIVWVNPTFERVSGCAAAQAQGQALCDVLGVEGPDSPWTAVSEALSRGSSVERVELPWRHPSGDTRWGAISAQALGGAGDACVAVCLQDLSEQHHLAELLDMAQEFGRLAVWERKIPSGEGRWDRHVFRFFGIDPNGGTPNFETASQRIHPDDRAAANYPESTRAAGKYEARYRVLQPDGTVRRLHSQWEVKNSLAGVPARTIGIMVDDTHTYELAQSFNDTSEQLRLAVDLGNIAIWRQDLRTNRFHYNYRAYQVLDIAPRPDGLSLEEVRAMVHPDDVPRVIAAGDTALESNRPVDMEARYRRADGTWRYVLTRRVLRRDAQGLPLEFVGVALDVTDRVRTEAALQTAHERVGLAARSVGIGTWEWNPASGESAWDEQMYRLRGREPQSTPPDAAERRAIAHPDDRDRVDTLLAEAVASGRSAAYAFRVVWPDGSVHWLASRSTPVTDPDGTLRYIGVNWDITDSVNAEDERHEKLLAQRESEAKSQFLARMSHELRTPLNAVLGFAQLLQLDAANAAPEQRQRVEHILSAGQHLLALINDVLDLSSLETGQLKLELEPVLLADVIAEALPLVTPLARDFGVTLHAGQTDAVVLGDRTRLRQVLVNLLTNAIKYNRPGGLASVETQSLDGHVSLRVRDTGRGMTKEQQGHLFEPFNRLGIEREGIEGTGIGLAIVKTLVTRMGGSVAVSSEPGTGSVFEARLCSADPVGSAESPPEPVAAPHPTGKAAHRAQLLYIEDNPINVLLVEELVGSRPGLSIVSETNGERGVARARALLPRLVLVDMQLPDFDGFEVLRRLRASPETAHIPCVAVSANAMPEDIARALAAGFVEYWTKPINFGAFLRSIEAMVHS